MVITGAQDNGTFLKDGNTWDAVIGGDGMECIIDYTNSNIMYGEVYYGAIRKSTNGGNSFSSCNMDDRFCAESTMATNPGGYLWLSLV